MKTTKKKVAKPNVKSTAVKPIPRRGSNNKKLLVVREKIPAVKSERGYKRVMAEINELMAAGGGTIKNKDIALYRNLAEAAQAYEQRTYIIEPPRTLEGLLEWKMYELKLKQKGLAKKLHISDAKLSLVMSGKQKPDTSLLKSIHEELGIDGNVLLGVV